jgi:formylglycine-generating enzyme required for sulfatase activity
VDFNFHTIPTGEYLVGMDPKDEMALELESPQFKCYLSQFTISDLITFAQWQRFVKDSGYEAEGERYLDGPQETISLGKTPVTGVSKHDADKFCEFYGVQLPTEAHWEVAATQLGIPLGKYWEWTAEMFLPERNHIFANHVQQTGNPVTDPYVPFPLKDRCEGLEKYWATVGSARGCGPMWLRFQNLYRFPLSQHVGRRHECPVDARTPVLGFRVAQWQRPMSRWQEDTEEALFQ